MEKSKNLDSLLNKIVEFNQPGGPNFKGFLYKGNIYGKENEINYYIKVIDSIYGVQLINDKISLKEGDEKFIKVSLKPKLMRVSLKSWHYRLVKYVLGNNAPTPKNLQNGCPYFWLLIFSIIILPFKLIGIGIWETILFIPKLYIYFIEPLAYSWINKLDDEEAYDHYMNEKKGIPLTTKLFINTRCKNDWDFSKQFMEYFILEKYKIKNPDSEEFNKKKEELNQKWEEWRKKIAEERNEIYKKQEEIRMKHQAKHMEYLRKKAIRDAKWDAKWEKIMKPINEGLYKLFNSIGDVFESIRNQFKTNPQNWKNIIKRTKQSVGFFITIILLAVAYFIVNALVLFITLVIYFLIAQWIWVAGTGIICIFAGIIYLLVIFFTGWFQTLIDKYKRGKKVWYIEPFKFIIIYFIFYPCKVVVLAIAYALLYTLWIPIKFIFYTFIWKVILIKLCKLIGKGFISLWNGIVSSTGIFGEYFGASYSDYCPGIEWVDTENEE